VLFFKAGDITSVTPISLGRKEVSCIVPIAITITGWALKSDNGNIKVDVYKRANDGTRASSSDTNVFATSPEITGSNQASSTGLSRSVAAGDELAFYITTTAGTAVWCCLTVYFEPA
jgi:hypothetical protein